MRRRRTSRSCRTCSPVTSRTCTAAMPTTSRTMKRIGTRGADDIGSKTAGSARGARTHTMPRALVSARDTSMSFSRREAVVGLHQGPVSRVSEEHGARVRHVRARESLSRAEMAGAARHVVRPRATHVGCHTAGRRCQRSECDDSSRLRPVDHRLDVRSHSITPKRTTCS